MDFMINLRWDSEFGKLEMGRSAARRKKKTCCAAYAVNKTSRGMYTVHNIHRTEVPYAVHRLKYTYPTRAMALYQTGRVRTVNPTPEVR